MSLVKDFFRARAIRKNASTKRTGIRPLSAVRKAVVFVDAALPDCTQTLLSVSTFFEKYSIDCHIYALCFTEQVISEGRVKAEFYHKRDINWYGRLRNVEMTPSLPADEDLFISLLPDDPFCVEYAARCSKASFKVGRNQLSGNVYDLVVNDAPEEPAPVTQSIAFQNIVGFLLKIC